MAVGVGIRCVENRMHCANYYQLAKPVWEGALSTLASACMKECVQEGEHVPGEG